MVVHSARSSTNLRLPLTDPLNCGGVSDLFRLSDRELWFCGNNVNVVNLWSVHELSCQCLQANNSGVSEVERCEHARPQFGRDDHSICSTVTSCNGGHNDRLVRIVLREDESHLSSFLKSESSGALILRSCLTKRE
uniref:Uncharacterized protein n=1 Tax=Globodera pallida TaxID=36090 RepID=A0A183CE00_GLOPA